MLAARITAASFALLWSWFCFAPIGFYTSGGEGRRGFAIMYAGVVIVGLVVGAIGAVAGRIVSPEAERFRVWWVSLTTAAALAVWPWMILAFGSKAGAITFSACCWLGAFAGTFRLSDPRTPERDGA